MSASRATADPALTAKATTDRQTVIRARKRRFAGCCRLAISSHLAADHGTEMVRGSRDDGQRDYSYITTRIWGVAGGRKVPIGCYAGELGEKDLRAPLVLRRGAY